MNQKVSRGILISGNWKMNYGPRETEQFFSSLGDQIQSVLRDPAPTLLKSGKLRACLIPPFLSLEKALSSASQLPFPLTIAAQNAHWEKKGAFTGEVSGPMLQEMGIEWVLIGHSERRQFFGDTDVTIRKRTESLLGQGFHVILCVGETREERESGKTKDVLLRQLNEAIVLSSNTPKYLKGQLILAYEPVWAIGTGLTATPQEAQEAHALIRKFLHDQVGNEASEQTSILYGGSVTPENAESLLSCHDVDGALVGGASLKPEGFLALLQAGAKILKV
jgi:triosephosphate isomerase